MNPACPVCRDQGGFVGGHLSFRPAMRQTTFVARVLQVGDPMRRRSLVLIRAGSRLDESTVLIGFAAAIGTAVGVAVILFYKLIDLVQAVALTAAASLPGFGSLSIILVVFAGLAVAVLLVRYGARDSDGENIPDVMRAVAKHGGQLRDWPIAMKTVAAGVLIGKEIEPVTPVDSLRTALQRMGVHGAHSVPVVEPGDSGKLLGTISRQEVYTAYDRELLRQQ